MVGFGSQNVDRYGAAVLAALLGASHPSARLHAGFEPVENMAMSLLTPPDIGHILASMNRATGQSKRHLNIPCLDDELDEIRAAAHLSRDRRVATWARRVLLRAAKKALRGVR